MRWHAELVGGCEVGDVHAYCRINMRSLPWCVAKLACLWVCIYVYAVCIARLCYIHVIGFNVQAQHRRSISGPLSIKIAARPLVKWILGQQHLSPIFPLGQRQ